MSEDSMISTKAWLVENLHRLAGTLIYENQVIKFIPTEFQNGHLKLEIPIHSIKALTEFLLFEIVKRGIKITTLSDKEDQFILDNGSLFIQIIREELNLIDSSQNKNG